MISDVAFVKINSGLPQLLTLPVLLFHCMLHFHCTHSSKFIFACPVRDCICVEGKNITLNTENIQTDSLCEVCHVVVFRMLTGAMICFGDTGVSICVSYTVVLVGEGQCGRSWWCYSWADERMQWK